MGTVSLPIQYLRVAVAKKEEERKKKAHVKFGMERLKNGLVYKIYNFPIL